MKETCAWPRCENYWVVNGFCDIHHPQKHEELKQELISYIDSVLKVLSDYRSMVEYHAAQNK